jgi:adenylate cyclase
VSVEKAQVPPGGTAVRVRMLGPFSVSRGPRQAGPWPRPSARRLCQLVLVSPGRRVSRDLVCEELFPGLDPHAAARAVSKALSMARAALAELGEPAASLLAADLTHIWASPAAEVDAEAAEHALRAALSMEPGQDRDGALVAALADDGELLADEPYADWALRPRERLAALRQEARLALARDRSRGAGQSRPEAVVAAWESFFEHDPASEEAAGVLVRAYLADGRREPAVRVYERCRAALEELGLGTSPALEEAYAAAAAAAAASRPRAPVAAAASPREELRTVTVLSAEAAMPAGLAGGLDPESLRDLLGRCLAAVIAEVEALGGTVTAVPGHGLQAVFGAPEAHEDDPERAARAAFRALQAVTAVTAVTAVADGGTPALRIGVETGPAVLGPVGGGGKVEYGAVGEVVGLAAALQSRARPGSALVGPVTYAAIEHLFTWEASQDGAACLGQPRPRAAARRPRLGGRGRLVGRQAEMSLLARALTEAVRGRGSVVLVTGEPGLGKTRLVQECRKLLAAGSGRRPLWLEGRCASYTSSTPYGLYRQLLAGLAGVAPDQPEDVVRPAVERMLTAVMGNRNLFPLLARMMGLSQGAALGRMSPGELQRATFDAWRSVVSRLVAASPVVLVLEDLHWADPTSLRLTLDLARLAGGRRLLVLATSRPEAGPEVAGLGTAHRVVLGRLPGAAEEELARSLMGDAAGREVLDAVLSSVEGNPLFLEERLTSLLETRALVREQGVWRISATAGRQVPQVLERLVRSRVDRLSPQARDAVRRACVLGAEFPRSLLAAVSGGDEPLDPALDELCARDLLQEVARRPEPVYRFRHALIQEAAYNGLLRAERRLLHGRVAWALEAASQGRVAEVAAVLGRHFAAAGEAARALRYFELAGDHATAAFANDEAVSSFRAALAIADEQPAGSETAAGEGVELRAKLANVLWRTGRRGEAREAFTEALRLAGGADPVRRAHLHTRLGRLEMADLRFEAAAAAFDAAEALLGEVPGEDPGRKDDAAAGEWLEMMIDGRANLYIILYQTDAALAALEAARPVLEARGSPARRYGFHMCLALARVTGNGGRVAEADIAAMREAIAAAAEGNEEKDVGYATYFLGYLCWLRGDLDAAREHVQRSLAMAERIGESILLGQSLLGLALTEARRHDAEAVRALTARLMATAETRPEFTAGARACQAWLAWRDRRPDDVIKLSGEVAELMAAAEGSGFYAELVHLWPLIAAHLDTGDVAAAVAVGRQLLQAARPPLPDDVGSAVAAAASAWDQGRPDVAGRQLTAALALAEDRRCW